MASYQYEQLNDESFQQLCQSLLIKAFPDLQCYPVGQADGGRDATVQHFRLTPATTGLVVFQVKFARRDLNPSEARAWLLRTLKNELPQVQKQIDAGAKRFVLVTNVAGTGVRDVGSMDKLQALLEKHIPIPASAWWRNDIDRRLDDSFDLKFAYPALLTGPDFLRLMVDASPSEGRERRRNAMTAFLSHQFDADREVKFKQVDLESEIFDLFTDVPLVPRIPAERKQKALEQLETAVGRAATSSSGEVDPVRVHQWLELALHGESRFAGYYTREETWLGAATLLLDNDFQKAEPLLILEGAPGQGKSTISQYICQIHRMRFLSREGGEAADPVHIKSSLRVPFKVELRDFAIWLSGGNPFGGVNGGHSLGVGPMSLEGFLAEFVRYASGGSDFDVSDLQATLNSSPALLVLDGLDEVAEINQRIRVVEEITSAVSRLNAVAASLQVVVTSRPTPFLNATILPKRIFATYSLESLTRPLVTEYAERWLRSRETDESDANEIRGILTRNLDEPHLRDLARNPMQLAILLSLIHRRGESLPDKRTALYDDYVQMFFDREAEKAPIVKKNRDLLVRIHRYVAWVLQAGAEVSSDTNSNPQLPGTSQSGTITETELKALLRDFLEKDGSDPAIANNLFSGMVERIVAIVSRVQGVFEFDVQTLREYFAARHLYETAPYSPAGDAKKGTISDRWRALSRNYYWLNVARFYAGCYSEGELPSLVDDLRALRGNEVFRCTSHPQLLTATLLADWVFSQRPRAIQDAVDMLIEPRGLRMLVAGAGSGLRPFEAVVVRDPSGKRRLLAACKELVRPNRPFDQVMDVVRSVIRPNFAPEELFDWWIEELRTANVHEAARWCRLGELLQCWSVIDLDSVADLLAQEKFPSRSVIVGLLHANRMDILESNKELFEAAVEAVLAGERVGRSRDGTLLRNLSWSVELSFLGDLSDDFAQRFALRRYREGTRSNEQSTTLDRYEKAAQCERLVNASKTAAECPPEKWNTSTGPWNRIVEQGITEFGARARFVEMANLAAGISSKREQCKDSPELFDNSRPLVQRTRYARLRAGSRKWWSKQLQSTSNADEVWMALLLFATWAGAKTIEGLAEEFDKFVVELEDDQWQSLYSSLCRAVKINTGRSWIKPLRICAGNLPRSLSYRTVALLVERSAPATALDLFERYLAEYEGRDPRMFALRTNVEVGRALVDETRWPVAIDCLRTSYQQGASTNSVLIRLRIRDSRLPEEVARVVVNSPLEFPTTLVQIAEFRCRELDAAKILPVGQAAEDEGWFSDEPHRGS